MNDLNVYLVGSQNTENMNVESKKITQDSDIDKKKGWSTWFPSKDSESHTVKIAINGGPGSGKGSIEEGMIKHLREERPDAVFILVAEAARDVIANLKSEGKFEEALKNKTLTPMIQAEMKRRSQLADSLANSLEGKEVYVIYDRDESNPIIYDIFFDCYDFKNEKLDEQKFQEGLSKLDPMKKMLNEKYDITYVLKPVDHEVNYACAHPQVPGAKVDPDRHESYKMAKEMAKALEMGAKYIYKEKESEHGVSKFVIVENTDSPVKGSHKETIPARVTQRVDLIMQTMKDRMEEEKEKNPPDEGTELRSFR